MPAPLSPAFAVFAALLAATGAMRLVELGVSVRRIRRRPGAVVAEPRLFPAMAALHAGLVVGPVVEVVVAGRPFRPWLGFACLAVLAAATALRGWTLWTLGGAWNVRVVRPDAVVTSGPYRYIRHPNYLCVILELLALPLFHGAWVSAAALGAVNAAVLAARIRTEEAALMQVDGWREAFADRARLIPGVF